MECQQLLQVRSYPLSKCFESSVKSDGMICKMNFQAKNIKSPNSVEKGVLNKLYTSYGFCAKSKRFCGVNLVGYILCKFP